MRDAARVEIAERLLATAPDAVTARFLERVIARSKGATDDIGVADVAVFDFLYQDARSRRSG